MRVPFRRTRAGQGGGVFDPRAGAPGGPPAVVAIGPPALYLAPGAYRARVFLRGGPAGGAGSAPVAEVRLWAERQLVAARAVPGAEAGPGPGFVEVVVPFRHADPAVRVAVEVRATGRGPVAIDRLRVDPDLRAAIRDRLYALEGRGPGG